MGFWKLDLAPREQRLQVLLRGLLGMKGDNVPKWILAIEPVNGLQIQFSLSKPLGYQPADFVLRRLHTAPCRTCVPDRRSHR